MSVLLKSMFGPAYSADSAGDQLIECDAQLLATGNGTEMAVWMNAAFVFLSPTDTTDVLVIDTVPALTVGQSWGSDTIGAQGSEAARWRFVGGAPFAVKMRFFYQTSARVDSASAFMSCAPPLPPGPPPSITFLQNQTPPGLEPGDTLRLSYAATSTTGLWQTAVIMSGPCDTTVLVPEHLQVTTSRAIAIAIPAACNLGVPGSVSVAAVDARLQVTTQSLALPPLVDRTPPILSVSINTPYVQWTPLASFNGFLFVGDAFQFNASATDNHAVADFVWDVRPAEVRDSILVSGSRAFRSITATVPSSWVGASQFRVIATDASSNVSDTVSTPIGQFQVFPTVGPTPTPTTIAGDIADVAFDTKRGLIYLLQSNAHRIVALAPPSLTIVQTVTLTDYAPAFDLSPGGDSLVTVLMNSHVLGVVDLTQSTLTLQAVPLPGLDSTYRLLDVRVAATGQALFIAQHTVLGGDTRLYSYPLVGGTPRRRLDAPDLGASYVTGDHGHLERSRDGSMIVTDAGTGALLKYDAASDAFVVGPTSSYPSVRPAVDSSGHLVAILGDLYDSALHPLRTVHAGEGGSALSPDGQLHFMTLARGVVRSRISDGAIIDRIAPPMNPSLLRVSPDGSTLIVIEANGYGPDRVVAIDLRQLH